KKIPPPRPPPPPRGLTPATALKSHAHSLHKDLQQVRRRFGRQCRGQGKVLWRLVRETEARRLALGAPVLALAQAAHVQLPSVQPLGEPKRQRVATQLREALGAHDHIATQSRRLLHGKR